MEMQYCWPKEKHFAVVEYSAQSAWRSERPGSSRCTDVL